MKIEKRIEEILRIKLKKILYQLKIFPRLFLIYWFQIKRRKKSRLYKRNLLDG